MLQDVISSYTSIILSMISHVKPYVNHLLWGLLTLDVIFMGFNIAMGKMASIEAIVERLLFMGFLIYIVTNFTSLALMFQRTFINILGNGITVSIYHNPSQIITWAHDHLIAPMNQAIGKVDQAYNPPGFNITNPGAWLSASFNHMEDVWSVRIIFNLVFLGILLAFVIIAVEMTVAIIEFYLILFFSLVLVPFTAWQPLRFIGTRAFTAVIAQALKLGIIVAITSIGMSVMNHLNATLLQQLDPSNVNGSFDIGTLGMVLAACAVLVFLSIQVPALAMSLISANPALSASGFAGNMMGIAAIGTAAVAGFSRAFSGSSSFQPTRQPSAVTQYGASVAKVVSSAPTSGGSPAGGAQAMFQPSPSSPSPGPRSSGAGVAAKVNPVSSETQVATTAREPADKMFQPISSNGGPGTFDAN